MAQRKDKSQAMREKILNTATQLFIQKGSEKTSMQDIAQTAGISKGELAVKGNEKEWRKHSVFALRSAAKVRSFPSLKRFDFSMGGAYTFDTE